MLDLLRESLVDYNLPATLLLALVSVYWLLVLFGITEGEGADGAGPDESLSGTLSSLTGGSSRLKKLGIGPVPLSFFGSFFAIWFWLFTLWSNHAFNQSSFTRNWGFTIGIWLVAGIGSFLLTKLFFSFFHGFFTKFQTYHGEDRNLVGAIGVVASSQVDASYGQIQVSAEGAPLLVNARVRPDAEACPQGMVVVLVEQHASGNFYYIEPQSSSLK